MPTQLKRPEVLVPRRDVSPIGASKFERPYPTRRNSTSTNTSLATPASAHKPFHYNKSSVASSAQTYSTTPTLIGTFENELKCISAPICGFPEGPDDWFTKLSSFQPDLPVDDTDECPDRATLAAVQEIPIYDAEGTSRPFGSLYDPMTATHQRQLVIFVRHIYCGACQAYLKALTDGISMQEYFSMPIPTSIVVIGCGKPDLIPHYKKFSGNPPFPMFADPSRLLFKKLGMKISLDPGKERPEYMRDISTLAWINGQGKTIKRSLKDPHGIRKRDVFRGGNPMQIGGEFLFEDGQVIWCSRMTHYRNHAEVALVRKLLQLDE